MALQVWLPLNGNLENQGLADFAFTGTGTYGNGKLGGKALYVNEVRFLTSVPALKGVKEFTICYWEKIDSTAEYTANTDMWGVGAKTGATTEWIRDELRGATLPGKCKVHMTKEASVGATTYRYFPIGSDSDRAKDTWCHVAIVKDLTSVKQYVNGVLDVEAECSAFEDPSAPTELSGSFRLGTENGTNKCPVWLQDFRIYDHCLTAKEVSLIAQGLMLHYTLSSPGNPNLIKGSNVSISRTSAGSQSDTSSKLSVVIPSGTTVTLSVQIDMEDVAWNTAGNYRRVGCEMEWFYKDDGTTKQYLGAWIADPTSSSSSGVVDRLTGSFHGRISKTWKVEGECRVNLAVGIYIQNIQSGTAKVSKPKLEIGSSSTSWCPNEVDNEFTIMGYDDGIEYDVSGFKRYGIKHGTLEWDGDTPRYNGCYKFVSPNYIRVNAEAYNEIKLSRDEITCSIWAYRDDWSDYTSASTEAQWKTMFSCQEAGGFAIFLRGDGRFRFGTGTGESSNEYWTTITAKDYASTLSSGWHMFTFTYDGYNSRGYIDGVLVSISTTKSAKTPIFYYNNTGIIVGNEAGTGDAVANTGYWDGKLSDFRVYATALSDDAIADLYHIPISVASNGTLLSQELTES